MPEPEGISAQGTIIAVSPDPNWPAAGEGDPIDWVDIAELLDITPPQKSRNPIEMTNHNSEEDAYVVGVKRRSELTWQVNFVPTNETHDHHTGLLAKWDSGDRFIWRITYPDGSAELFSGFVSNVGESAPVDDKLSASISVRPTGRTEFQDPA